MKEAGLCGRGLHPWIEENLLVRSSGTTCRLCNLERSAKRIRGGYVHGPKGRSLEERFFDKVAAIHPFGCWEWNGGLTAEGYGQFSPVTGNRFRSDRWAYEFLVGKIPEGLEIDHLCRNRRCVNPQHLDLVTRQENMRRMNELTDEAHWALAVT